MCEQCKPEANSAAGTRRRRLWDLPHACHCPVIGVCLPLNTLRTLVNKTLGGQAQADDYEIHVGAVAECMRRNRLSKRLQDELDRRYARPIQALRAARTAVEIAEMWTAAIHQGDVAGAFWAALTHPRCDDVLQDVLLRDMHMLQHQAGAATRQDIARYKALRQAHADLEAESKKSERAMRARSPTSRPKTNVCRPKPRNCEPTAWPGKASSWRWRGIWTRPIPRRLAMVMVGWPSRMRATISCSRCVSPVPCRATTSRGRSRAGVRPAVSIA